jgi:hypothetical protein
VKPAILPVSTNELALAFLKKPKCNIYHPHQDAPTIMRRMNRTTINAKPPPYPPDTPDI